MNHFSISKHLLNLKDMLNFCCFAFSIVVSLEEWGFKQEIDEKNHHVRICSQVIQKNVRFSMKYWIVSYPKCICLAETCKSVRFSGVRSL